MKKAMIVIVISTMLAACGNTSKPDVKAKFIPRSDTVKTLGVYAEIPYKKIHYGLMYVIIKNGIVVDSMLQAKQVIDTIPYFLPEGDSAFRPSIIEAVSFDFNLDSAFKKVSKWVKLNEKYLKTDTLKTIKK